MEGALIGLLLWIVFAMVFARLAPLLWELFVFIFEHILEGILALVIFIAGLIKTVIKGAARIVWKGFSGYLVRWIRFPVIRLWHRIHCRRLGEDEFSSRALRKLLQAKSIGQKKRENIRRDPRFLNALYWHWWGVRMAVLGVFYARAYDEEMVEAIKRAKARGKAKEEEEKRRARAEEEQRQKREKEGREKARREKAQREREAWEKEQREEAKAYGGGHDSEAQEKFEQARRKANDPYARALRILALNDDCTRKQFNAAYRIAMMEAHPDAGGEHHDALAVNWARDEIMKRKGWS